MVHGAWRMAHGAWRMAHGAWCMVHGAWCMVHDARRMVHGAWQQASCLNQHSIGQLHQPYCVQSKQSVDSG